MRYVRFKLNKYICLEISHITFWIADIPPICYDLQFQVRATMLLNPAIIPFAFELILRIYSTFQLYLLDLWLSLDHNSSGITLTKSSSLLKRTNHIQPWTWFVYSWKNGSNGHPINTIQYNTKSFKLLCYKFNYFLYKNYVTWNFLASAAVTQKQGDLSHAEFPSSITIGWIDAKGIWLSTHF